MRVLISILLIISVIFCDYSYEKSQAQPIVDQAISNLYNYNLEKTNTLLDSAIHIDENHAVIPFLKVVTQFMISQTDEEVESSHEKVNNGIQRTIPIYKQLIKKFPNDPEYLLYLGSTYGLRARISYSRKDWLGVMYDGYQGLKYVRKANNIDSKLMDAYTPIGLMEYSSCLAPTPIQWFAKWAGLHSDCNMGKEYMEMAINNSYYSWIEGSFIISYIYLHIDRNYKDAERIIDPLISKFPGHPFFPFLKAELLARQNRWNELKNYRNTIEHFAITGPLLQKNECMIKLLYIDSLRDFYLGGYQKVIESTSYIINNYHFEFDWLKGFAYLLRGKAYDSIGNRALAKVDYNHVLEMDYFYPEVNEANTYLVTPFSTIK